MKLTHAGCALLLSLAAGCAHHPPHYVYMKEGGTAHQRTTALSECTYQIKLNKTPPEQQKELTKLCMQGKGWRLRPVN